MSLRSSSIVLVNLCTPYQVGTPSQPFTPWKQAHHQFPKWCIPGCLLFWSICPNRGPLRNSTGTLKWAFILSRSLWILFDFERLGFRTW